MKRTGAFYDEASIPREVGRGTLDAELAEWLEDCPRLGAHESIADARRNHDSLVPEDPPPIGRVESVAVPCDPATVTVRVYRPPGDGPSGPALIYLHGGGWTVGAVDQFEGAMRIFAEEGLFQVYAVEYRLAPESRHPTRLKEAEAVLRRLVAHSDGRGVDPTRTAIGGDSAGGNMSAILSLMMRDEGGPRPSLQVLLYPECKLPFETRSGRENHTGYYLETTGVFLFAWNYAPDGVDPSIPYITPINAESDADLPPA